MHGTHLLHVEASVGPRLPKLFTFLLDVAVIWIKALTVQGTASDAVQAGGWLPHTAVGMVRLHMDNVPSMTVHHEQQSCSEFGLCDRVFSGSVYGVKVVEDHCDRRTRVSANTRVTVHAV